MNSVPETTDTLPRAARRRTALIGLSERLGSITQEQVVLLFAFAIGGGHLIAATRRWVKEMEVPPSELAKQKWAQARTAVEAGTSAWQNGTKAGAASTS